MLLQPENLVCLKYNLRNTNASQIVCRNVSLEVAAIHDNYHYTWFTITTRSLKLTVSSSVAGVQQRAAGVDEYVSMSQLCDSAA